MQEYDNYYSNQSNNQHIDKVVDEHDNSANSRKVKEIKIVLNQLNPGFVSKTLLID